MTEPSPKAAVRTIRAEVTWELRQRVLRPHQTIAEMAWPNDDAADAVHFGAFIAVEGGPLIGVASVVPDVEPDSGAPLRLRGMAIAPELRGQGIGALLLASCLAHTDRVPADLWCTARVAVEPFYVRAGFVRLRPDPFDIAGIGVHVAMRRVARILPA